MNKLPAIVIVLVTLDSLHFVFARLLLPYLPPTTSSFLYMTLATLQLALFAIVTRKLDWRIFRKHIRFFLIIGLLVATSTSAGFSSVAFIDPGTASLLARMSTIFALGLSLIWLKERLLRGEKIGAAIAVAGVLIISFQWGDSSEQLWLGTALVMLSTFCYALHAAIVKRNGEQIDLVNFFVFRMATSSLFLFMIAAGRGNLVWPTGPQVWLLLLLTATINVTISRSLYYVALRRFRLSIFTIFLTLSPVLTILWSMALFGERPSLQGLIGGAAVIGGVIFVTISKRQKRVVQVVSK